MKNILLLCSMFYSLLAFSTEKSTSTPTPNLRFKDGRFKIAQLTDIHWRDNSSNVIKTKSTILSVLQIEKPDLLVLSGDIITGSPVDKGYEWLFEILKQVNIPYVLLMGNHDPEVMEKKEIFDRLAKEPLCIGHKGKENLSGFGNFILPIQASDGSDKIQALLYCMDSGDYSPDKRKYGQYGWIKRDQVEWYRQESQKFTQQNGGTPLPALAFFHIPLPEYKNITTYFTTYGAYGEECCSPQINSGMFFAMTEMKDVMGVFVGHDHHNDFIGQECGIALAYGRVTGYDADSDLERGARIIELQENQFSFTSWITTPKGSEYCYHYPEGIISNTQSGSDYLPALPFTPEKQGVQYSYYEGHFSYVTDLLVKGEKKQEGIMKNFDISDAPAKDHYAYMFKSYIYIDKKDVYTFALSSDDGAILYIDGELLINNDGSHSNQEKRQKIGLEKGFHEIQLFYFEDFGGENLLLEIAGSNQSLSPVTNEILFLPN